MHKHMEDKKTSQMKPQKPYGGYTIQPPKTFCQGLASMHVDEIKLRNQLNSESSLLS